MQKKVFSLTNSLVSIFLLLGILIFINVISNKFFKRIDLTKNKSYTISQGTKNLLKNLNSNIVIKAYFTKDMPTPYNDIINYAKDMLKEFEVYSKGKVKLEVIDPDSLASGDKEQLTAEGIMPVQAQVMKDDKFELKKGFVGISIYYLDKHETIPVLTNISNLEYDTSTKISKLIEERPKTIGILSFSDVFKIDNLKQLLGEKYSIRNITIDNGKLNDNVDMLILSGGNKLNDINQLFAVDQFVMEGKPVLFLVDSYNVELQSLTQTPQNQPLIEYLTNYGIKIGKDLIFDAQNQRITISQQQGFYTIQNIVNFPYMPLISEINKNNPITSSINEIGLAFVTGMDIAKTNGLSFEWLIKTSKNSMASNPPTLNPTQLSAPNSNSPKGPFVAGGILNGKFISYFANKSTTFGSIKSEGFNNKVVIFSDSDFVTDSFLNKPNASLVQNIIDWSLQGEDLIKIRSKEISIAKLKEVSPIEKNIFKYLNILLIPILLIIIGLLRLYKRKLDEVRTYE